MPELCFNLWYYLDSNQNITSISGKAYLLGGSDTEKEQILLILSQHDYLTAEAFKPLRKLQRKYPGGVNYSTVKLVGIDLFFEKVFASIIESLPDKTIFPDEKIYYATPLYNFGNGYVPAVIGDGFIRERKLPPTDVRR